MAQGKLTPKQKCFIEEYLIDLNATQAAIRAGYSVRTAREQAARLLTKAHIQEELGKAMAKRSKRTGVSQDRIIHELAKVAFMKMTNLVDSEGRLKETASEDDLSCIESIKFKQSDLNVEREVKVASKLRAIELLMRHLGMLDARIAKEQLQLSREKFEYEKEKDAGTFQEYEDLADIEQDIYGNE